jgi:S1-C subfamily serine protease
MSNVNETQLLQSFSDAVAQLAGKVSPSVVQVDAGRSRGTGIVWSPDGLVVTASHIVGDSGEVRVRLNDGKELAATVTASDRDSDVALLKVAAGGLTPLVRAEDEAKVGQFVLALANAFGRGVSATSGIVTSRAKGLRGWSGAVLEDALVSDAKLNPGYSGGPVVDAAGRLLGMNVAHFSGRGIAIPVASLASVAETLSREGRVKRGFLGVVIEPIELPQELAASEDVGQSSGLLVLAVEAGSPARKAGVAIGDLILRLGDSKATDELGLRRALSGDAVGRKSKLQVLRGEKLTVLEVEPREAGERA